MLSNTLAATIIAVSLATLSSSISAQRSGVRLGKIDRTFGNQGTSFVEGGLGIPFDGQSIVLSDGKIALVNTVLTSGFGIQVTRLLESGVPDSSFGNKGHTFHSFGSISIGAAIAQQPDGKLLVGGYTGATFSFSDFVIFRLTAEGELDTTFGDKGGVIKDFAPVGSPEFSNDTLGSLALLPNGKILVAGTSERFLTQGPAAAYSTLLRLNPDGTIDGTFGNNGVTQTLVGSSASNLSNLVKPSLLAIQPDGKILAGISIELEMPNEPGFYEPKSIIQRYGGNGTLDPEYANGGSLVLFPDHFSYLSYIALLPNGNLLALVSYALVRIDANGAVDPTFGVSGYTYLDGYARNLVVSGDQRITVAGWQQVSRTPLPGFRQFGRLERFYSNGERELRFGTGGVTQLEFDDTEIIFTNLHIVENKYVVTGLNRTQGRSFVSRFFATK